MGAHCCRFANIQDKDAIQEKILEKKKVADTAENVRNLTLQFLGCTHGGSVPACVAQEGVPVTCHVDIIKLCAYILVKTHLTTHTMRASLPDHAAGCSRPACHRHWRQDAAACRQQAHGWRSGWKH